MATALIVLELTNSGKFVLQRRDDKTTAYPNMLAFFGGKIEDAEEPLAAAHREINEETSLHIKVEQLQHVAETAISLSDGRIVQIHLFRTKIPSDNFKVYEGRGAESYTKEEVLLRSDTAELTQILVRKYL